MKKIQVTTVQKTANVEVIELNSSFVAKAVRAADAATKLHNLIDKVVPPKPVLDDNGNPIVEEGTGNIIVEPDYTHSVNIDIEPEEIVGKLCQFVRELEDALLGE